MKPRTTKPRRVTAGWPLSRLVAALRRARWGVLGVRDWHGLRAVLLALCDLAGDTTGRVEATAWQVAGRAGYGERWTRSRLQALEQLGVLTWWRGGVSRGRPQASIFIISRRRLAELVEEARPMREAAVEERRRATNERLRAIRTGEAKSPEPRFRRSAHAALSASLPLKREASTGRPPPRQTLDEPVTLAEAARLTVNPKIEAPSAPSLDDEARDGPPPPVNETYARGMALVRAALAAARKEPARA